MKNRSPESSPQTCARIGWALYLFIIVAALFGEVFVRGRLKMTNLQSRRDKR